MTLQPAAARRLPAVAGSMKRARPGASKDRQIMSVVHAGMMCELAYGEAKRRCCRAPISAQFYLMVDLSGVAD